MKHGIFLGLALIALAGCSAKEAGEGESSSNAAISTGAPAAKSPFAILEETLSLTENGTLDYTAQYGHECALHIERFGDEISVAAYLNGATDPGRKVVFASDGTVKSIPAEYQKAPSDAWVCGVASYAERDGLGECIALEYTSDKHSATTLASVKFRSGFTVDELCGSLKRTDTAPASTTL